MKKVLLTTCAVVCAAVAASAQGVGTVKLMNWEAQEYQKSNPTVSVRSDKKTTRAVKGFAAVVSRANAAAALAHKADQEKKANAAQQAANDTTVTADAAPAPTADTKPVSAPAAKPVKKAAAKKTFWDYILSTVPMDGHCSTQPFK